jgi:hypothetical protein
VPDCEAKPPKNLDGFASRAGWMGAARDMAYLGMVVRASLLFRANVLLQCAS